MKNDKVRYYIKVIKRAMELLEKELEDNDDVDIDTMLRSLGEPKKMKQSRYEDEEEHHYIKKIPLTSKTRYKEQEEVEDYPLKKTTAVTETPVKTVAQVKPIIHDSARKKHIQDLLAIESWPEAVPKHLATSGSTEDQINRANSVLDMLVDRDLEGKDFLDFGCGDGWTVRQVLSRGVKSATGFDLIASPKWEGNRVKFTNVFNEIAGKKYDVIFMYDVLDHCEDPEVVMKQIRSLIKPDGVVYVRSHPWTSKHASHLYTQGLNKAYIHLFLSWEELVDAGYSPMITRQEKDPLTAYRWWFENASFHVESERERKPTNEVNPFFLQDDFKRLIIEQQQLHNSDVESFFKQMPVDFFDFTLTPQNGVL